jgi:S1-C subfamily serine protease
VTRVAVALSLLALPLLTTSIQAQSSPNNGRRSAVWVVTPRASGSGFLLNRGQALVVTAHHVVSNSLGNLRVVFPAYQGGRLVSDPRWYRQRWTQLGIPGRVVRYTRERDLALIQLRNPSRIPSGAQPARLARTESRPGNRVSLVSSASGTRQTAFARVSGRVQSVGWSQFQYGNRGIRTFRAIHSRMPALEGNSGAAVLSTSGEVVGVLVARIKKNGFSAVVTVSEVGPFVRPALGNSR